MLLYVRATEARNLQNLLLNKSCFRPRLCHHCYFSVTYDIVLTGTFVLLLGLRKVLFASVLNQVLTQV
jgi:hypothetical protein